MWRTNQQDVHHTLKFMLLLLLTASVHCSRCSLNHCVLRPASIEPSFFNHYCRHITTIFSWCFCKLIIRYYRHVTRSRKYEKVWNMRYILRKITTNIIKIDATIHSNCYCFTDTFELSTLNFISFYYITNVLLLFVIVIAETITNIDFALCPHPLLHVRSDEVQPIDQPIDTFTSFNLQAPH